MFNFRKESAALGVLISSLIFSPALFAADFTFNVPVKFTNLHADIKKVRVQCSALRPIFNAEMDAAFGQTFEVVTNGAIDKTIIVTANAEGDVAAFANRWECKTHVCLNDDYCRKLSPNPDNYRFTSAPNSSLVMELSGSL
ncbi:MAG: hypothetical protein L3J28_10810 [Candidatus Polarisedimenticolaceae bacterium]|nr:hypothetical protein [Candidatus Polarisedimenticolaceae bacterium]